LSLADVPINRNCRIDSALLSEANRKYDKAGIRSGNNLRVICRHPFKKPRFVEVEVESALLVTLPFAVAKDVKVQVT
jgi:hypothetical protein